MRIGDIIIMRPHTGQDVVGRVVSADVAEVTLADAVLMHDYGSRQRFEAGEMEGDDQRVHCSRHATDVHLPRFGCAWQRWGDEETGPVWLERLRAWGDQ